MTVSKSANKYRLDEIDVIKSIAIIFVVILHTIPESRLRNMYSDFHIGNAVPIFMVIAGATSALSSKGYFIYLISSLKRILFPFIAAWLLTVSWVYGRSNISIDFRDVIASFVCGGIGPGSYFTPLFIQHIVIFPLVVFLIRRYNKSQKGRFIFILSCLVISVAIEYLCIAFHVPPGIYRVLYVRYVFAAILGAIYIGTAFRLNKFVYIGTAFSAIYMLVSVYFPPKIFDAIIYPSWAPQHAPSYFYTITLVSIMWNSNAMIKLSKSPKILLVGRASYHIFLCQMLYFNFVWFRFTSSNVFLSLPASIVAVAWIVAIPVNICLCAYVGVLFYNMNNGLMLLTRKIFRRQIQLLP